MTEYDRVNQANWDSRAPLHATREDSGYQVQRYIDDPQLISSAVELDRQLLGNLAGVEAVHLQCHIGTDTLSLARLGASVTGLDYSARSVDEARKLVAETKDRVEYVEANVYDAASVLPREHFDLVYTGIGALCWLPDIKKWAQVVASLLKPGGVLHIREGHPILFSIDDELSDDLHLRFSYFETVEPLTWDDDISYVETTDKIEYTRTYQWNHGMAEIITALLEAGLQLETFIEHDSAQWEALPGQMEQRNAAEWIMTERHGVIPLSFTIRAVKVGA